MSQILRNPVYTAGPSKPPVHPRRAYVTFLAGDGDDVKGVVGLAKGLRKVGSSYPLVVAVLPDVPVSHRELLASQGCIVREVKLVNPPENGIAMFARDYYGIKYSKLRIWDFIEYKKMVYLDADIQVFDNIDLLFDLPDGSFYAVTDCCKEKTWSHMPEFEISYCRQQRPDQTTSPKTGDSSSSVYFNAGMFVFEPSIATSERILAAVETMPPTAFAEQDFLNVFFKDVYMPIPHPYNFLIDHLWLHPENVELEKVKAVHYCAPGSKPWSFTGNEEHMDRDDVKMLVKKWWDIYNDDSLNYNKEPASVGTNAVLEAVKRRLEAVEISGVLAAVEKEPVAEKKPEAEKEPVVEMKPEAEEEPAAGLRVALSKFISRIKLCWQGSQDSTEVSRSCR